MAEYQPKEDEIRWQQEETAASRKKLGMPEQDESLARENAIKIIQQRDRERRRQGLGQLPGGDLLTDMAFGQPVPTVGIEKASEATQALSDTLAKEYAEQVQYTAPQIKLAQDQAAQQRLASNYAQLAAMGARDVGIRSQDTARQERALAMAEEAAFGRAPSAAEIQGRQQLESALQSQLAMAARARGGNMSLALRSAGMNAANMQAQAAQSAAMLRAQEQAQAREQFMQGSGQMSQLGLDAAAKRNELMRQAAAQYGSEAGSQVEQALKMQQANAGFLMETRGQALGERARRRDAALAAQRDRLAAEGAVYGARTASKTDPMKIAGAVAQMYMAGSSGGGGGGGGGSYGGGGGGGGGYSGSSGTQVSFSQERKPNPY